MRQLTQRVSIRYELKPLNREEVAAYAVHRLTIAGGARSVVFTRRSLNLVQRHSGGIPRLINLLCGPRLIGWLLRPHEPHRPESGREGS